VNNSEGQFPVQYQKVSFKSPTFFRRYYLQDTSLNSFYLIKMPKEHLHEKNFLILFLITQGKFLDIFIFKYLKAVSFIICSTWCNKKYGKIWIEK
jgi:ribosome biogenesis GTPase A